MVLEEMVPAVEFDSVFDRAWTVYFDSIQEWMLVETEAIEGTLI